MGEFVVDVNSGTGGFEYLLEYCETTGCLFVAPFT